MKYSLKEYVEVYEVIKNDEIFLERLPREVLNYIKSRAKKAYYIFQYDEKEDIKRQVSRNALLLLTYLYLKYVLDDEDAKLEMKNILVKNSLKRRGIGGRNEQ